MWVRTTALRVTTKFGETTRQTATGTDSKPAEVKTFGSSTLPLAARFMWYTVRMPYKDKNQRNEYQKAWMARRRQDWLSDKSCVDCGSTKDLQVDHVDASTKISHRVWSWSDERRLAELDKCVTRCSTHHREKTIKNREHAIGTQISSSKLDEEKVRLIREKFLKGQSKRGLARDFNVDEKAIRLLLKGETWKHVDMDR